VEKFSVSKGAVSKFTRFLTLALLAVAFSPVFAARPDDYVIEKGPGDVGLN
jgi:hypothetical protein